MLFVLAAFLACGCVDLTEAIVWPPARDYIDAAVSCGEAHDHDLCAKTRSTWLRDYESAIAGQYQGQRRVAYCLSTGCDHAIRQDRVLGCAWRMVVAASDGNAADGSDARSLAYYCGPDMVDGAGRKDAEARSKAIAAMLAGTQ